MSAPLLYRWDGEAMRPLPYFFKRAIEQFKPGETYTLVETEARSMNSHRHFFACINEAHSNLPEDVAQRFPTPDHLRKFALTYTPFCDVRHFRAASHSEAVRVAKYLSEGNDFSRLEIDGKQVTQYIPQSQALQAMPNNRTFQQSKNAVLDVIAKMIGVPIEELNEAGRRAA